jgi:hypothetical protein
MFTHSRGEKFEWCFSQNKDKSLLQSISPIEEKIEEVWMVLLIQQVVVACFRVDLLQH